MRSFSSFKYAELHEPSTLITPFFRTISPTPADDNGTVAPMANTASWLRTPTAFYSNGAFSLLILEIKQYRSSENWVSSLALMTNADDALLQEATASLEANH